MDRMVQDFEEIRAALGIRKWVTLGTLSEESFRRVMPSGTRK